MFTQSVSFMAYGYYYLEACSFLSSTWSSLIDIIRYDASVFLLFLIEVSEGETILRSLKVTEPVAPDMWEVRPTTRDELLFCNTLM